MMLLPFAKFFADTGVMDDVVLPEIQIPFADTVRKTCSAVKDKFNRSTPFLKQSAAMAGASCVLTSMGTLALSRGVAPLGQESLYALGIGILLAAGSAHSFWQAIKA